MTVSFKHEDAYKLLLRFRHHPEAIEGFIMLNSSTVTITDALSQQTLIGRLAGDILESTIFSFSHFPYDDVLDSLCALSSSSSPMIIRHVIKSKDERLVPAFDASRLGLFAVSKRVERDPSTLNLTLTANIRYPTP